MSTAQFRLSVGVGLLLAILAQSAAAQRAPKMGTGSPDWDKMGKSSASSAPQVLSKKDLEEMSPIARLLDKKKDLKLTDAQVAALKELETAGNCRDAELYEATDSLRKAMRPSGGGDPEAQRIRAFSAREAFTKSVADLRANFSADATAALAVLDEAQQPVAKELLAKQAKEADKTIEEKMRAGGGRAGGRPGGRPVPPLD